MKQFSRSLVLNRVSKYITQNIKDRSDKILRLWADQCEFIIAQRFRRSQQMLNLYTRIWEDRALKLLIFSFKKQLQKHGKAVMLSSVGIYAFDWDKDRISYSAIKKHLNEIDYVRQLKRDTLDCPNCNKRRIFDVKIEGIDYCSCPKNSLKQVANCGNINKWMPYIERKNMLVWRKEEKPGLYAYKVHVSYEDITAADFLHVQIDTDYRKEWDNTAISLEVVDSDPVKGTNSNIIYWEMLWPKLFANRDYVYNRRYFVDRTRKTIVIVNKSVIHPCCPIRPQNQRVQEYWSYMVIKPRTTFMQPGLEFVLTYFDNPGVTIPSTITSWVAQTQMPDYLSKLYHATQRYANNRKKNDERIMKSLDKIRELGYEYPLDKSTTKNSNDHLEEPIKTSSPKNTKTQIKDQDQIEETCDDSENTSRRWWSYLYPYSYFA